jgi:hypothetical protein
MKTTLTIATLLAILFNALDISDTRGGRKKKNP